jgi:uncharacterized cupredoxin-like copper-binding protein
MRKSSRWVSALLVVILAAGALTGCGDDDAEGTANTSSSSASTTEPGPTGTATITGREYAFDIDGAITADQSTVEFRNEGAEYHMTSFARMKPGVELNDVLEGLQQAFAGQGDRQGQPENPLAALFEGDELGAPGSLVAPGQSNTITVDRLEPGTYAVMCFIPGPDRSPHLSKGMIDDIEVTDAAGEEPERGHEVSISDGEIDAPTTFDAGELTFDVTNTGKQKHEFTVYKPKGNTTIVEADRYFSALFEGDGDPGKPPGELVANVFDFDPDETVHLTAELEPGTYILACTYEDDATGEDHTSVEGEHVTVEVT